MWREFSLTFTRKADIMKIMEHIRSKKTYNISLGGVMTAVCLLLMFLTAVFPMLSMALPLYAGILVYVVLDESGVAFAVLTYAAVSLLSFFLTPNIEASVYFAVFFGLYPILKFVFEKLKSKTAAFALKLVSFNVIIITAFFAAVSLFNINDLLKDFEYLGDLMIPVVLITINIMFLLYDYTLSIVLKAYLKWFKPTFLRKKK
jgi:hypothetical protein